MSSTVLVGGGGEPLRIGLTGPMVLVAPWVPNAIVGGVAALIIVRTPTSPRAIV